MASDWNPDSESSPHAGTGRPGSDRTDTQAGAAVSPRDSGGGVEMSWSSLWGDMVATREAVRDAMAWVGTMVRGFGAAMTRAQRQYDRVVTSVCKGLIWIHELPATASSYCGPYNVELRRRGLAPLSPQEELDFLMAAILIARPEELGPGERVPLAEVSLAGGRTDVAARIWGEQLLEGDGRNGFHPFEPEWDDWQGEAFVGLSKSILPSIQRRLDNTPLVNVRAIMPRVASRAYLMQSLRNYLFERLGREAKWAEPETPTDLAEERIAGHERADDCDRYAAQQVLTRFLERSATDLDRRMLEIWRQHPDWSARRIAQQLRIPERTVRYRWTRMIKYLREMVAE